MKALMLNIVGIVQGVGFRPFIYRIAVKNHLKGYVKNIGGSGVEIYVEGEESNLRKFLIDLKRLKPKPAIIDNISIKNVRPIGYDKFIILKSTEKIYSRSVIPPDIGVCEECLREVMDRRSRWYNYPFNSCAVCGPRFTIIEKTPYDRKNTSMKEFPLCKECLKEYNDPENFRRFHIQGISCPRCGPRLFLYNKDFAQIDVSDPLDEAAKLLNEGYILAVKGLGGYHIAALASDDEIVLTLRRRKNRPRKPFALMALNLDVIEKICIVNEQYRNLLKSPQKPIVIMPKRENSIISKYIAPNLKTLGVMLPYTPLHYLLLRKIMDKILIMTSGNRRGLPIAIKEEDVYKQLKGVVDFFLVHNRKIVNRCDDSVIRISNGRPIFLRRSRGYAPLWINIGLKLNSYYVALGAHLSTAGAIGFENKIVLTQYIGDIEYLEVLDFLEKSILFLLKNYGIELSKVFLIKDLHPQYISNTLAEKWIQRYDVKLMNVQHHFAHIASVMAENKLSIDEKYIGIAMDGTGYGLDGNIWGGEILEIDFNNLRRIGHLEYITMPGGDFAIKYPVRMLIGFLHKKFTDDEILKILMERDLIRGLPKRLREAEIILRGIKKYRIKTSSMGRFLDSVSAFLGLCFERDYEGEPAIVLEENSWNGKLIDDLCFKFSRGNTTIIYTSDIFQKIFELRDLDIKSIGYSIQYWVGYSLAENAIRNMYRHENILLVSGGSAVNDIILKGIRDAAYENDVKVLVNSKVPPGDGGIALGQIFLANIFNENSIKIKYDSMEEVLWR